MAPMFDRRIIEYLRDWKDKPSRKPLVVRGARQVGKTSAILIFGKSCFKEIVHLNLEKTEHLRWFKKALSLQDLLTILQVNWKAKLIPGETLIFIDEIQNAPNLIQLLRFFYEDRPDLHVIAAGSLLEFVLKDHSFSMPVGRLEYLHLGPMTFEEFLEANGEQSLKKFIGEFHLKETIPLPLHQRLMEQIRIFCVTGGMPEAEIGMARLGLSTLPFIGMGHLDFAGSGVVHTIGGMVGLAGAVVLGPRFGKFGKDGKPITLEEVLCVGDYKHKEEMMGNKGVFERLKILALSYINR